MSEEELWLHLEIEIGKNQLLAKINKAVETLEEQLQQKEKIDELQTKLQQKENIIKEVREYISQLLEYKKEDYYKNISLDYVERILDILEGI